MADDGPTPWQVLWDLPLIGELVQTVAICFPTILVLFAGWLRNTEGSFFLIVSLIQIAWLWGLERFAGRRLVVPIIPIPWLWIFVAFFFFYALP
ncbi:MAG: hypothetical protein ACAH11_04205, partial [Sphingomonas sp.]